MDQLWSWYLAPGCLVEQGQNADIQLPPLSLWDRKPGSWGAHTSFVTVTAACFFCAWYVVGSFHLVFSNLLKNLCCEGGGRDPGLGG